MSEGLEKISLTVMEAGTLASIPGLISSGYEGRKDKEEGKSNYARHGALHALAPGATLGTLGALAGGGKLGLQTGLIGAGIGATAGLAAYGTGRLSGKRKDNTVEKTAGFINETTDDPYAHALGSSFHTSSSRIAKTRKVYRKNAKVKKHSAIDSMGKGLVLGAGLGGVAAASVALPGHRLDAAAAGAVIGGATLSLLGGLRRAESNASINEAKRSKKISDSEIKGALNTRAVTDAIGMIL